MNLFRASASRISNKKTAPISRPDLIRDCIRDVRLWPGCETIREVGILIDGTKFEVRVMDYGAANKRLADRALRCIEREKQRRCHVVLD